jgi:hypothetical protein
MWFFERKRLGRGDLADELVVSVDLSPNRACHGEVLVVNGCRSKRIPSPSLCESKRSQYSATHV